MAEEQKTDWAKVITIAGTVLGAIGAMMSQSNDKK